MAADDNFLSMPFLVAPELVEPVTRSLLGAIDVDGGPTDEQLAVLRAVVTYLWERPDLDFAALAPLGPREAATAIEDDDACWIASERVDLSAIFAIGVG